MIPALALSALLQAAAAQDFVPPPKDRLRDVEWTIGTQGSDTLPSVTRPFGFTQWTPVTRDWFISSRPYKYQDGRILGFLGTHQPAVWMGDYGYVMLTPGVGPVALGQSFPFFHNQESAAPNRYRVQLQAPGGPITVEIAAARHSALLRFTFPPKAKPFVVLEAIDCRNQGWTSCPGQPGSSEVRPEAREIAGKNPDRQSYRLGPVLNNFAGSFVARFSEPFADVGSWQDDRLMPGDRSTTGLHAGSYVTFKPGTRQVLVKVGTSFLGEEQARTNLDREIPGWDFDGLARDGAAEWNAQLDRVDVAGGSDAQRREFYTALAHALLYPRQLSEYGRYYSAFDDQVHEGDAYNDYSLWDTFRAEHPLLTLVAPRRADAMAASLVRAFQEGGRLPLWPNPAETNIMLGTHADCVIADAFVKGLRGYDVRQAYAALRKDAFEPPAFDTKTRWPDRAAWLGPAAPPDGEGYESQGGLTYFAALGYVPYDKTDESASRTVEFGIDDACAAAMARELAPQDEAELVRRTRFYRNLFNPATGMLAPKSSSGTWGPDPNAGFTEGSPWTYLFGAMHDPAGMVEMLGGPERFSAKLDENFDKNHYVHTNEPGHHYAYLYDYAGKAWKTQQRVRDVMQRQYQTGPQGLKGDDDCGQMSAWFVLSALGFYPVSPASGVYALGSPLFDQATLFLAPPYRPGRFTVIAHNQSPRNPYLQKALLNGKPLAKPFLSHQDIVAGGSVLELWLGPKPNTALFKP